MSTSSISTSPSPSPSPPTPPTPVAPSSEAAEPKGPDVSADKDGDENAAAQQAQRPPLPPGQGTRVDILA